MQVCHAYAVVPGFTTVCETWALMDDDMTEIRLLCIKASREMRGVARKTSLMHCTFSACLNDDVVLVLYQLLG